jgi:hypothetical protein
MNSSVKPSTEGITELGVIWYDRENEIDLSWSDALVDPILTQWPVSRRLDDGSCYFCDECNDNDCKY